MRSATAYELYKDDGRFEINSAGTDPDATQVVNRGLLEWADSIVVMEKHHRNTIRKLYPDLYESKTIVCLYIPDEYDYMDIQLQFLIKSKFEDVFRRGLV